MTTRDADLSQDTRSYIQSIRDSGARDAAREYARLDPQVFQARIGPAVDDICSKLELILRNQHNPPPRIPRRYLVAIVAVGGVIGEQVIAGVGRLLHIAPH